MIDHDVDLVANRTGVINSLRLSSPLQVYGQIAFQSSDSLMPPVIVPLKDDLQVRAGDVINLRFRFRCETNWRGFECEAKTRARTRELATSPEPAEAPSV
jgi:hypothetical protein